MTRKELDFGSLDDFTPRRQQRDPENYSNATQPEASNTGWGRREASQESQFTIRAKMDTIARFKALCRPLSGGRYTYGEMLEILMNKMDDRKD